MNNKTILITGARGFLGSTLMLHLREHGYAPVALAADIRNREAVFKEIADAQPAWVIHAAAKIDVGECERDPVEAQAVNVEGTRNVVDASAEVGASVIFISSTSVFSGHEGNYKEEDLPEPLNVYSRTKVEGEKIVAAYDKGTTVRLLLLGLRPDAAPGKNFFEWVVRAGEENKDLKLFNDQFVNHISNLSTARYVQKIIESSAGGPILHIGSRDVVSKAELARLILRHFPAYRGTLEEISVEQVGDGVVRPKQMWLNTDKAAGLFGPMPSTEEEVHLIWTIYKQ